MKTVFRHIKCGAFVAGRQTLHIAHGFHTKNPLRSNMKSSGGGSAWMLAGTVIARGVLHLTLLQAVAVAVTAAMRRHHAVRAV